MCLCLGNTRSFVFFIRFYAFTTRFNQIRVSFATTRSHIGNNSLADRGIALFLCCPFFQYRIQPIPCIIHLLPELYPHFIDHFDSTGPVNISTGTSTSIRELAETIRDLTDYEGEIVWDESKPNGQAVRIYDVSGLHSLGLSCRTPLQDGLRKTIEWFSRNYESRSDGLRL